MRKEILALCNKLLDDKNLNEKDREVIMKFALLVLKDTDGFRSSTGWSLEMALNR